MEELLNDISAVLGVQGCWICDEEGALLARNGTITAQDQQLAVIGRVLIQTISALSLARRRKVGDIDLVYENSRLLAKNLGEGCLCIQGAPDLNVPLVNLTANLVVRKLKERKKQGELPSSAPADPSQGLLTMGEFLETLLKEFGDQGIGREQLLTIAKHRLGRLGASFPFMTAIRIAEGKILLDDLPVESVPAEELGQALTALVEGMGVSISGILGEKEATAKYLGLYIPFQKQHTAAFDALGIGESLKDAFSGELSPSFMGVDMRLD